MTFSKVFKRELEVAFSKHSQPVWFRVLKYIVIGCILYFFWGRNWLLTLFLVLFAFSLMLHFWYRYKTQGWTKTYGLWKHEKDRPVENKNDSHN